MLQRRSAAFANPDHSVRQTADFEGFGLDLDTARHDAAPGTAQLDTADGHGHCAQRLWQRFRYALGPDFRVEPQVGCAHHMDACLFLRAS